MRKRGAPSALASSQVVTTTTTKKAKLPVYRSLGRINLGKGFPKTITETHRYCQLQNLSTGASGIFNSQTFSCNGMYDPDITGTGHQPLYFDQLSALYNHYTVTSSKITITGVPRYGGVTPVPITLVAYIDDNASTSLNVQSVVEQTTGKRLSFAAQANEPKSMVLKWSAKKNFGGSVVNNANMQGSAAANPIEQSYFLIGIDSSVDATGTSIQLYCTIEYTAVWSELKELASS